MTSRQPLSVVAPKWIEDFLTSNVPYSDEQAMDLLNEIAAHGANRGYGPFAAALTDHAGNIIELNINQVMAAHDCGAHAECLVLRNGMAKLIEKGLQINDLNEYSLFTTGAPCVGCSGMIWLYRPSRVLYCVSQKLIEQSSQFNEGPVSADFWTRAAQERQIKLVKDFGYRDGTAALKPFEIYRQALKTGKNKSYLSR